MANIWQQLREKGPIMVLAPMADVTDAAFRQVIRKYSGPDFLMYTEFVSADGLGSNIGRPKLMRELYFTPAEQPIIAQLFSSKPEKMEQAAKLCAELGFAGIDINMGCPDKTIEKQGCGAAMIKNPKLAQEIIAAAKKGAPNLPISVKTRVGYNKVEIEDWTKTLLEAKPAAITFHLRTRKEMSKVPANWDLITVARDLAKGTSTLILGNGDVQTLAEAKTKARQYNIDGVMIGRGIFGNPWLFSDHVPTTEEKLRVAVEHTKLFEELFRPGKTNDKLFGGHTKSFAIMKKHFKAYINPPDRTAVRAGGFDGAHELRLKLMEAENASEVEKIIHTWTSDVQVVGLL